MSQYTTIVIRMPEDPEGKVKVQEAFNLLTPYLTATSLEDEMTVLELIELHDDFPAHIAAEARAKTAELHAQAEGLVESDDLGPDPEEEFIIANEARLEREHERSMDGPDND